MALKKTTAPAKPAPRPQAAKAPAPPVAAAKPTTTTAVARTTVDAPGKVAMNNAMLDEFKSEARAGLEGMTAADMAIPRIAIIQSMSPQINPRDPAYIEGATVGMVFDNVSHELWDGSEEGGGMEMLFVHFTRSDIEWIPRSKGGGFVKNHGADSDIMSKTVRNADGANMLPSGNEIVSTVEYFAMVLDRENETYRQCVISFSKTNMTEAKRFATVANMFQIPDGKGGHFTPAVYYRTYRVHTVVKENEKGSWFVYKITPGEPIADMFPQTGAGIGIYRAASAFKKAIQAGKVQVKDPAAEPGAGSGRTTDESAPM